MSANPKFTFAGSKVVKGMEMPRWETRWGGPLWLVASYKLSTEEAKNAVCYYACGTEFGNMPDYWLPIEED